MAPLKKVQWEKILKKAVEEGMLTCLDPSSLLTSLRGKGLTKYEEERVEGREIQAEKMRMLEKFLRTRPSLEEAFLRELQRQIRPLYDIVKEAIDKERSCSSGDKESDDSDQVVDIDKMNDQRRLRIALDRLSDSLNILAKWAVPRLHECGCISSEEGDEVENYPKRLITILKRKELTEMRKFLEFLKVDQEDILREVWDEYNSCHVEDYTESPTKPAVEGARSSEKDLSGPVGTVDVTVKYPDFNQFILPADVDIRAGEHWAQIQGQLKDVDSPVAVQFGCIHGRDRRAYSCTVPAQVYCDEQDGKEVAPQSATFWVRRFLRKDSNLRWDSLNRPGLIVFSQTTVEEVGDETADKGEDALFDPRYVLLLWGLRSADGRLLVQLLRGEFCDPTGRTFSSKELPELKSRVLILVPNGGSLPRIRVPQGKFAVVYSRTGDQLRVDGDTVQRRGQAHADSNDEWIHFKVAFRHQLTKDVTAAMRR